MEAANISLTLVYIYNISQQMNLMKYNWWQLSFSFYVSERGCQSQGDFQIKEIQVQHANLDMHLNYWND